MVLRVGVKFCGNCNPQIDLSAVFAKMKIMTKKIEFVSYNDPKEFEKLLILSSCSSDCAARPPFAGTTVVVGGAEVDYWPVAFSDLPKTILDALLKKHI